ncbi:tetratricopeptide repeat protein [Bosea sp. 117]|uniref:tetratricopeptide repeat protein n=1 Tax=Bosea sp. 117 TaxID=1125973 RepID=UPI000494CC06|nr:tetratricopeptide repeat protein [Bosea sp. 117]
METAKSLFSALAEKQPDNVWVYVGLGRTAFLEEDFKAALDYFQAALDIDPEHKMALLFSAEARSRLGDTDRALEEYEEASQLDPSLAIGHLRISRIHMEREEYDQAEQRLRESLAFNPQQAPVRMMLAELYEKQGRYDEARDELERLIDIKPDSWLALYKLSRLFTREEKHDIAQALLEEACDVSPGTASLHYALGGVRLALKDQVGALAAFEEARRLKPQLTAAGVRAADCLVALGRKDEALKLLGDLSRRGRQPALIHQRLGDLYLSTDRYSHAVEEYRAAVFNNPELQEQHPELAALIDSTDGDATVARQFEACFAKIKLPVEDDSASADRQGLFRGNRPGFRRRAALAGSRGN